MSSTRKIESIYPLSPMQQGMLFHTLRSPQADAYFEQVYCTFDGNFCAESFRRAWQKVIADTPVLRTAFVWKREAEPLQAVLRDTELPWHEIDWRSLSDEEKMVRFDELLRSEREKGFDLSKAPLTRLCLIHWKENTYRFLWNYHHILLDGWSTPLVLEHLFNCYQAYREGNKPPFISPVAYREYISWLQRQDKKQAERFWREELQGFFEPLQFGWDNKEASISDDTEAHKEHAVWLDESLTSELQNLARKHQLTLNVLLQGAWSLLLSKYTEQSDIVFGITVAGRPAEINGIEKMVGLLINTIPLRVRIPGNTSLLQWLKELQQRQAAMRDFSFCSLADIQRWSEISSGRALFESIFVFENYPVQDSLASSTDGLAIKDIHTRERTNYPLTFVAGPGERLMLKLIYDSNRFSDEWAQRFLSHYATLLSKIVEGDGDLGGYSLLGDGERDLLLGDWIQTGREIPLDRGLASLFVEEVRRRRGDVAVRSGSREVCYGDLRRMSRAVAFHLRACGVHRGDLIGVRMERGVELIAVYLGILEAGAAYVPFDLSYPEERVRFMVSDSNVSRVVLDTASAQDWSLGDVQTIVAEEVLADTKDLSDNDEVLVPVSGEDLAYVMYTSGSTGIPKGIAIPQRAVTRLVLNTDYVSLQPGQNMAQVSNASFDAATFEIWGALLTGGCLVIVPRDVTLSPPRFASFLSEAKIDSMFLTTALFNQTARECPDGFSAVGDVLVGGEQADAASMRRVLAAGGPRRLLNVYGPTENTTFSSWYEVREVSESARSVPIGKALANSHFYVLDEHLELVPIGVAGEFYLGGLGLAHGYWDRAELTASCFLPDPFGAPGSRMYRTGDWVRWLPDGNIDFLGRRDDQVKVRGFRIELGEIEAALNNLPQVSASAVVVHPEAGDRLIAYWVKEDHAPIDSGGLREALGLHLPGYMVPSVFVELESLPLTPNGKLDRKALPAPGAEGSQRESYRAPQTPLEELLCGIWERVLSVSRVGLDDNFFDLGGHSLLATQLLSRVRNVLSLEVPMRTLFTSPRVYDFVQAVGALQRETRAIAELPLEPAPRDGESLPLSFAQQRLWFLDQMAPLNAAYTMAAALRLQGDLNIAALERSLRDLVQRHESLRTSFPSDGGRPAQRIVTDADLAFEIEDSGGQPEEALARRIQTETSRPFDLAGGPLFRVLLLRLKDTEHLLVVSMHHIVSDGWSLGIFTRELGALYTGHVRNEAVSLPPLPIQYGDFSQWQRRWLKDEVLERQLTYWREQLADLPTLALPASHPRPPRQTFAGATVRVELPEVLSRRLVELSRAEGSTLFMTLFSAYALLLSRYAGEEDIPVGTPVANRNRSELEGLIGFFVNMLVLRADVSGDPAFTALLQRIREMTLAAYAHQDVPFEMLVETLQPQRDMSRQPLFQVHFALHNAPFEMLGLPGLEVAPFTAEVDWVRFDLECHLWQEPDTVRGYLAFNTDLFDQTAIERFRDQWLTLLEDIAEHPQKKLSELNAVPDRESRYLLEEWNDPGKLVPVEECIHGRFHRQSQSTPDAPALVFEDGMLTYRQLEEESNRLAHYLRALGVGPEVLVGLYMDRSPEMVVGILGILKAGGAYVPVDTVYPQSRIEFMLADSGVGILLTHSSLLDSLPSHRAKTICLDRERDTIAGYSCEPPSVCGTPSNAAYVIYTSGSTGKPKGSLVTHANVIRLFDATDDWFHFDGSDVWTLFHSYAFDFSVWEIWGALLYGGKLVIVPYWVSREPGAFYELLCREGVTVLNQTPSAFYQLIASEERTGASPELALRFVVFGGEALDLQKLRPWFERHGDRRPRLVNMYGITETTVHVTYCELSKELAEQSPGSMVGRPIPDLQVYVLDENLNPVPIGAKGELYVSGGGLSRGYLGRPELTAERMLPHPFSSRPGERLYRTGDVARIRDDGELEYAGRADSQVKIRGFRIELGEIESALAEHPGVREAVVLCRPEADGGQRLCAYIVQDPEYRCGGGQNREWAGELVEQWKDLYDDTYQQKASDSDPTFNITGWNSSYTGQPIPAGEMKVWLDTTVERIVALRPRRVLEIGCGTGMLLFRVAPGADEYRAWDFSDRALAYIDETAKTLGLENIRLEQRTADEVSGVAENRYDTVILNSVIQYFPGADYLLEVIEGAVRAVVPGGAVFLGDIRNLHLLDAYHASVQLAQCGDETSRSELANAVYARQRREEELVLSPEFFLLLRERFSKIGAVEIQIKRGRAENELTKFRYDVVLRIGEQETIAKPPCTVLDARSQAVTANEIETLLADGAEEAVLIENLKNPHVADDVTLAQWLQNGDGPSTAAGMRSEFEDGTAEAIEPEELIEYAERCGYKAAAGWSITGSGDRYDIAFVKREVSYRPERLLPLAASKPRAKTLTQCANDPLQGRWNRTFVPELRQTIETKLPNYMLPATYTFIQQIPLTPNGKIDTKALPVPTFEDENQEHKQVSPRTTLEMKIAAAWRSVLERETIGVTDSFFDLGGHSLKAVELVQRLRDDLQIPVSIPMLFDAPTIELLAGKLSEMDECRNETSLVPIQPQGDTNPLVVVHPIGGSPLAYIELARCLGTSQPCYGLQAKGMESGDPLDCMKSMASAYLSEIRNVFRDRPICLGGWSMGGMTAFEMAQQCYQNGHPAEKVILFEAGPYNAFKTDEEITEEDDLSFAARTLNLSRPNHQDSSNNAELPYLELLDAGKKAYVLPVWLTLDGFYRLIRVMRGLQRAYQDYVPQFYPAKIDLIVATENPLWDTYDPEAIWSPLCAELAIHPVQCGHNDFFTEPHVHEVAEIVRTLLA